MYPCTLYIHLKKLLERQRVTDPKFPRSPQDAEPICAGNAMPSGRASRTSAWLRMGWWDDDGQASLGIWGVKVLQPMGIEDPNLFHVPSPNAP